VASLTRQNWVVIHVFRKGFKVILSLTYFIFT